MTYIVNDNCIKCKLMDCVEVCPVPLTKHPEIIDVIIQSPVKIRTIHQVQGPCFKLQATRHTLKFVQHILLDLFDIVF